MGRPVLYCLLVFLSGAVTGCAAQTRLGEGPDRVGEIGPASFEGRVRVVGSDPFPYTVVEAEDGQSRLVTGVLLEEIRRLAGARVRLTGRLVRAALPGTALEASSWEILSVGGERPLVGRLERDADGFRLVRPRGTVHRLGFVSGTLADRLGAFIWVVVDEGGGVVHYGVVRAPKAGSSRGFGDHPARP